MAAILVHQELTDLAFVFQKLSSTLTVYTERYPELLYIKSGFKLINKDTDKPEDVNFLTDLNKYLQDNLSEYYVIKILRHNLHQDIQALLAGKEVDRKNELYLNFL